MALILLLLTLTKQISLYHFSQVALQGLQETGTWLREHHINLVSKEMRSHRLG